MSSIPTDRAFPNPPGAPHAALSGGVRWWAGPGELRDDLAYAERLVNTREHGDNAQPVGSARAASSRALAAVFTASICTGGGTQQSSALAVGMEPFGISLMGVDVVMA